MGSDGLKSRSAVSAIRPDRAIDLDQAIHTERNAIRRWIVIGLAMPSQPGSNNRRNQMVSASKGYGFPVADNGWPDVLLHVAFPGATAIRRPMKARDSVPKACDAPRAIRRSACSRWTNRWRSIQPKCRLPDAGQRDADQRSGTGAGQMVRPPARLRLPDHGSGYARHLRSYGDVAALRHDGTASRPVRHGALWPGGKGMMATEIHPEGVPAGPSSH